MKEIRQASFVGERALFGSEGLMLKDCIFDNGESPLKESSNLRIYNSRFGWKYPLWYCKDVKTERCTWMDMARAGVWYSDDISVKDALIQAPKNFRRCNKLSLKDVVFTDAKETLWNCNNVELKNVTAKGDYFAMNCDGMDIDRLNLDGNYAFDGVNNVEMQNSRLLSKDAFWNSTDVTVYDSYICGEYLGWNSKRLTFINCTIESLQGLCYIDELVMKNCKLINTTLAFEYSNVDAEIRTKIDSVFNPGSGRIKATGIKELIVEKDKVDPSKTRIVCDAVDIRLDAPEWVKEKEDD